MVSGCLPAKAQSVNGQAYHSASAYVLPVPELLNRSLFHLTNFLCLFTLSQITQLTAPNSHYFHIVHPCLIRHSIVAIRVTFCPFLSLFAFHQGYFLSPRLKTFPMVFGLVNINQEILKNNEAERMHPFPRQLYPCIVHR